jgi:hypothetical protein
MRNLFTYGVALGSALAAFCLAGCGSGGGNTFSPSFTGTGAGAGSFSVVAQTPTTTHATQGQAATFDINALSVGGFGSSVALSVTGLPTGASASFSPSSVVPTANGVDSTLTVTTSGGGSPTPAGTYTLVVSGNASGVTHQTSVTLVVDAPAPTTGSLGGTIQ